MEFKASANVGLSHFALEKKNMKLLLGIFVEIEQNSWEEDNPEIAYMLKDSSPSLKSPSKSLK